MLRIIIKLTDKKLPLGGFLLLKKLPSKRLYLLFFRLRRYNAAKAKPAGALFMAICFITSLRFNFHSMAHMPSLTSLEHARVSDRQSPPQ